VVDLVLFDLWQDDRHVSMRVCRRHATQTLGGWTHQRLSQTNNLAVSGLSCLMSIIAHSIGFPRPKGVDLSELLVVSIVASIGLTVALFVTGEAFQADAGLERDAKFGALLSILAGLIAIVLGKILKVGGEDDSRLANMTMSEQMEEMFFLSEIRGEAEAEAVHQATKATADAALKENKRFARQITELNSQIRTQNKKIKQLQSQRILGLKDMTLKQVLDTLNAGDAAPLDTTATAAGEVPGA
jgi:hypothetical protein